MSVSVKVTAMNPESQLQILRVTFIYLFIHSVCISYLFNSEPV